MHTLDHHIRPQLQRTVRKIRRKRQMGTVSLIHDKKNASLMDGLRNCPDIRYHTVIGGGGEDHRLDARMFFQQPFHPLRGNPAVESVTHFLLRVNIYRFQIQQRRRMIDGLVAIAGHEYLPAFGHTGAYRSQNSRRASIDEKKGPSGPIHPGSPFLGLFQNPFRMMQIVKTVDLRDIERERICKSPFSHISLMTRHMKRAGIPRPVSYQLFVQTFHFLLLLLSIQTHRSTTPAGSVFLYSLFAS